MAEVLHLLREQIDRLAARGAAASQARVKIENVLAYVTENASRMDYPRYRREGLPVSSALVESLVKQFNQRVKATDKFWVGPGAEAVLQVRAAYLSEDGREGDIYRHRADGARAVGARRRRAA